MGYGPSPRISRPRTGRISQRPWNSQRRWTRSIVAGVATATLGLGVMGAPAYARAGGPVATHSSQQTIKKLQAQIRQLKNELAVANAEIARLKGQSSTTVPAAPHSPTTTAPAAPVSSGQPTLLAGNVKATFAQGSAGKVSVVYSAPLQPDSSGFAEAPFVVRNNTSKPVTNVQVSTTVLSGSTVVASGQDDAGTNPIVLNPGEWALGYIDYDNAASLKPADTVQFSVQASPSPDPDAASVDVTVTQANNVGESITGLVKNTSKSPVESGIEVTAYCFDGTGKPVGVQNGDTPQGANIAVGGTASYEIDTFGTSCKSILVGATGLLPFS